jgi:hypothetical protein
MSEESEDLDRMILDKQELTKEQEDYVLEEARERDAEDRRKNEDNLTEVEE